MIRHQKGWEEEGLFKAKALKEEEEERFGGPLREGGTDYYETVVSITKSGGVLVSECGRG